MAAPAKVVGQSQPAVTQLVSWCCKVDRPSIKLSRVLWRRRPNHKPLRDPVGDLLQEVKICPVVLKTTPIEFPDLPARFLQKKLVTFTVLEDPRYMICEDFPLLDEDNIIIRIVVETEARQIWKVLTGNNPSVSNLAKELGSASVLCGAPHRF